MFTFPKRVLKFMCKSKVTWAIKDIFAIFCWWVVTKLTGCCQFFSPFQWYPKRVRY
jgi:hypothetical protein